MANRTMLAAICLWGVAVAPAFTQVAATLVLRSGARVSGNLVDLNAGGFSMQVEGKPRTVRPAEVAYVQFVDPGDLSLDAQKKLAAGEPFAVLRGGGTADGRLVDVGGRAPLRLTLEGRSGAARDLSSAEVAVVYLGRPSQGGWQPPAAAAGALPATPGQKVFTVAANRAWTSTLLTFEEGDVVGFKASGRVRLSPNAGDVVPPEGAAGTKPGSNFPIPGAPRGALIGRIDNGPAFMIGAQHSLRMPGSGVLHLGVNDDLTSDNGGDIQVTVSILPRRR